LNIADTLQSECRVDLSLQKNNVETAQFEIMKQKYDDAMAAASLKASHPFF
jgi:hypothetical protein